MTVKLYIENPEIGPDFEATQEKLSLPDNPSPEASWLKHARATAMDKFLTVGIPGPKVEEWKYTNLGFLANENFALAHRAAQTSEITASFDEAYMAAITGPVIVFVNGYLDKTLSRFPKEGGMALTVFSDDPESFRQDLAARDDSTSLNNLNRALVTDGYSLKLSENTAMAQPVQIIHIVTAETDRQSARTRGQITLARGAKAKIIESFMGPDAVRYWSHTISKVTLEEDAELSLFQVQLQGKQAIHMTELHSSLGKKANFNHMSLQLGAGMSRTEIINNIDGEFAEVNLKGAYLGRVKQSHDIFTRVNHNVPNGESHQLFRGVSDEGGKSAFQGKVIVARDAQKTNAHQSNKNLLLSRKAEANAKPELLIYADDVKCSHGATVGELDLDQLFYLRSRGLDEKSAKELLVEAFISEVFDGLDDEILLHKFKEKTQGWLTDKVVA